MDDAQEQQAMQQLAAAQEEPIGADTQEEIQRMRELSGQ
jgi:hypothetical protein